MTAKYQRQIDKQILERMIKRLEHVSYYVEHTRKNRGYEGLPKSRIRRILDDCKELLTEYRGLYGKKKKTV